jgi:UDP-N-acetylmuramoylalanine--D-glutamate ligase
LRAALATAGVPLQDAETLDRAVAAATAAARPGETVLLTPAYKSFDQYTDFEARGDHFRELARTAAGQQFT